MRIEWESKRRKNQENTFNDVQNLVSLASIRVWSCLWSLWKWLKSNSKLWILEFLNLQTVRFKLNFQVKIIRFSFELGGFEERGKSWRTKILSNELRGSIFIAFGSVICTLEFSSKFGNVMHKLTWACTCPWSNSLKSKCICSEVGMKLEWKGNVKWSFELWFLPMMHAC